MRWMIFARVLAVSGIFFTCSAEGVKNFTLEKRMALYHLNEFGVPVTGQSSLLMTIQACGGVVFSLKEHHGPNTEHTILEIGTGEKNMQNSIFECAGSHDDCEKKSVKPVSHEIWKCPNFTSIWLKWTEMGLVSFGEGLVIGKNIISSYQKGKKILTVNYIGMVLLKDENVQVTVIPNPNLSLGSLNLRVRESTNIGTVLYTTPPGVRFVKGDNQDHPFELADNKMLLRKKLDYEKQRHHVFDVSVTDGVSIRLYSASVNVEDEFDESPKIRVIHGNCRIPEELAPGTDVGQLFDVTDADIGDSLGYSITGEDAKYLDIDSQNGRVTMKARLDRDGKSGVVVLHHLQVKVTDKGNNTANIFPVIEIIDVDDNPPRFDKQMYVFHVHPKTKEKAIGKLPCYDDDMYGYNRLISNLTIRDGNDHYIFHISDTILYADLHKLFKRYGESKTMSTHALLIEATDTIRANATPATTKTVALVKIYSVGDTVQSTGNPLNEHSPLWKYPVSSGEKKFKTVEIPEDTEPGTVVLSIHAVDGDTGDAGKLVYSFTPKESRSRKYKPNLAAMYFQMDPVTGNLSVAMPLDRDKKTGGVISFSIQIIASDCGTPQKSTSAYGKLLLKNVNDNGPVYDKPLYKVSPECDHDLKKHVLRFQVTDPDNDIIKDVRLDRGSMDHYAVHKYGRVYNLKMKDDTVNRQADSYTVITLYASDTRQLSTAKVIIHLRSCNMNSKTTTVVTTLKPTTSDLTTPSSSSMTTTATFLPERTTVLENSKMAVTDAIMANVASTTTTSKIVTEDGKRVVTICKTTSIESMSVPHHPKFGTDSTLALKLSSSAKTSPPSVSRTTTSLLQRRTQTTSRGQCVCPDKKHARPVNETQKKRMEKKCNTDSSSSSSSSSIAIMVVAVGVPSLLVLVVAVLVLKKYVLNRHTAVTEPEQQTTSEHAERG